MNRVVDDRMLVDFITDPTDIPLGTWTTGLWYLRLCQAVLSTTRPPSGQLSAPIAALPDDRREAALRSLVELPHAIGLVSLRELGPRMSQLRERHRLNLLSLEALAAAEHLDATLTLRTEAPQLQAAAAAEGIGVDVSR